MRKLLIFLSIISIFILAACDSQNYEIIDNDKPKHGIKKGKIKNIHKVDEYLTANTSNCMGLYKDKIFYMTYEPSGKNYVLKFRSFEGKLRAKISFNIGKGPAEIMHTGGVKVSDEKLYVLDLKLRRLSYFKLNGNLIDTLKLKDTGLILNFDVNDNILSFYSRNKYFLGRYDIKRDKIIEAVKRKNEPNDREIYRGGTISVDNSNGKTYFGSLSTPYKIDLLNHSLKTQKRYSVDYDSYDEVIWRVIDKNHRSIYGDFMINSMSITDKYIYAPVMTKSKFLDGKKSKLKKVNGAINIFDKKSGKLLYRVENKYLKNLNGMYSLVGANDKYIVLYVFANKGSKIYEKLIKKNEEKYLRCFIVINNPV